MRMPNGLKAAAAVPWETSTARNKVRHFMVPTVERARRSFSSQRYSHETKRIGCELNATPLSWCQLVTPMTSSWCRPAHIYPENCHHYLATGNAITSYLLCQVSSFPWRSSSQKSTNMSGPRPSTQYAFFVTVASIAKTEFIFRAWLR
jgi:hypothetical protein